MPASASKPIDPRRDEAQRHFVKHLRATNTFFKHQKTLKIAFPCAGVGCPERAIAEAGWKCAAQECSGKQKYGDH
eukprot:4571995-Pyramimonas_sp.AAC.1